jgi:hypothetical protein
MENLDCARGKLGDLTHTAFKAPRAFDLHASFPKPSPARHEAPSDNEQAVQIADNPLHTAHDPPFFRRQASHTQNVPPPFKIIGVLPSR